MRGKRQTYPLKAILLAFQYVSPSYFIEILIIVALLAVFITPVSKCDFLFIFQRCKRSYNVGS